FGPARKLIAVPVQEKSFWAQRPNENQKQNISYPSLTSCQNYLFCGKKKIKILSCEWFKKRIMNKNLGIILLALGVTACNQENVIKSKEDIVLKPYPKTEKIDQKDDYFGTTVEDPYRWLEDDLSEQTKQWVTAQNEVTQDYLKQIPFRDAIYERLESLWNYEKEGAPFKEGD